MDKIFKLADTSEHHYNIPQPEIDQEKCQELMVPKRAQFLILDFLLAKNVRGLHRFVNKSERIEPSKIRTWTLKIFPQRFN